MNKKLKEDMIFELTKIYIKSYEEERKGNIEYLKKSKFLEKFIKFIKEFL